MSSPLVRQLCTLLDKHPTDRLLVFVPRPQLGTALTRATGLARGGTAGLTMTTPVQYAEQVSKVSFLSEGKRELEVGPRFFLTSSAVQQLSGPTQSVLTGNQPLSGMVAPLTRTFHVLRMHGISPEVYRARAAQSDRQQARADAYQAYQELMDRYDFFDAASLLTAAVDAVEREVIAVSDTRWAILNTVSVTTLECAFIDCLRQHSVCDPALFLLGPHPERSKTADQQTPTPVGIAASQFSDAPTPPPADPSAVGRAALVPGTELSSTAAEQLRFWTATGERREVQSVFEDILQQKRSFDTVEIAYTDPQPYLSLLDMMAERYEVPVSLSTGRSLDATRPGQALEGFFDWIANGCTMPDLISLLRSGLLQLDVSISEDGTTYDVLNGRRAATLLAETRYPDDPSSYENTFAAWIDRLTDKIDTLDAKAGDQSWVDDRRRHLRKRRAAVRILSEVVNELLSHACILNQNPVPPSELAAGAEAVLKEYGPTAKPTGEEDERTPDEVARNFLLERLRFVSEKNGKSSHPPRQLAGLMKTWLTLTPFVRALRPQPGCAHIVPLESAGYAGRDHLYIVGLDADSTRSSPPTDPLLTDPEREALSHDQCSIPLHNEQTDVEDWRIRQAMARHDGTFTFLANTYDIHEDEDLFEAPLFLHLKETAQMARGIENDEQDPQVSHWPLASTRSTVLRDADRWTSRNRPPQDELQETLSAEYPWIQAGLEARHARASDTYTLYDGLLAPDSYPELNPLTQDRPVTAGRLETYARSPFAYFLRYVLDVQPLDEPALDDVAWLDARNRGAVLHDTFRRFMATLGRRPTTNDRPHLRETFEDVLDAKRREMPPPSEVVYETTRRQLWNDALLFLRVEAARTDAFRPYAFELGFGYPPHRRDPGDYANAPTVTLDSLSFSLRGRIDRIDELPDGTLSVWDYKTGSSRRFEDSDLLSNADHLQWALYAYALETLEDKTVSTAGYFFTSTEEMGKRIAAAPADYREEVARIIKQISEGMSSGAFPITKADDLRYSFDRLFHDYGDRRTELTAKDWPSERPAPPSLRDE